MTSTVYIIGYYGIQGYYIVYFYKYRRKMLIEYYVLLIIGNGGFTKSVVHCRTFLQTKAPCPINAGVI